MSQKVGDEITVAYVPQGLPQEAGSGGGDTILIHSSIPEDRIARIERLVEEIHSMLKEAGDTR